MILRSEEIAHLLEKAPESDDPLIITPEPDLTDLRKGNSASVDLRLGTFFISPRRRRAALLDVIGGKQSGQPEPRVTKGHYVPFGSKYILHPGNFVLGNTLEWVRLPVNLSAYVIGKSSWGRRGLVIATATGVHPWFSGCLTLELANLGEIPVAVWPGMEICQLFLHKTVEPRGPPLADGSNFVGYRRPRLGEVKIDEVALALAGKPFDEEGGLDESE